MKSMKTVVFLLATLAFPALLGAQLPEGPGKEETMKHCRTCHEVARSISPRQDKDGWIGTMNKMVAFGMKTTDAEYAVILDYLAKHYPAEDVPRVNVNTASGPELESILNLKRSQAKELIAYREKNGEFHSLEDLKKVTAIEFAKFEAKKDRILFK
jgi:competence protein ComEA